MPNPRELVTRRRFLAFGTSVGSLACVSGFMEQRSGARARLRSRPKKGAAPADPMTPGEHPLALGSDRDGIVYVPASLPAEGAPLIVALHGAGGAAKGVAKRLTAGYALAEEFKAVVLATDSRDRTWDMVRGGFGPDVTFLDRALEATFVRNAIDPKRIAIGGFSDGASYALSLGLMNGDLFTHILAFSPGFLVADEPLGRPAIYVSHGTNDEILPIHSTSRRLVPSLQEAGYVVRYREFPGPHTVPAEIVREAFEWMNGKSR